MQVPEQLGDGSGPNMQVSRISFTFHGEGSGRRRGMSTENYPWGGREKSRGDSVSQESEQDFG